MKRKINDQAPNLRGSRTCDELARPFETIYVLGLFSCRLIVFYATQNQTAEDIELNV